MRKHGARVKQEDTKPRTAFLSCVYVVVAAVVSFLVAGLVMAQIDFYELFGLSDLEIPLLKAPADEIPEWVIQIALAVVIFVILQALMVIIAGLFSRGEREEEFSQHPPNPWER